ncbi:hypothetical protein PV379_32110 [Streptomyces caniscabiei]|nr:hypothetical protein [Streptomyces caniscabiei]MDX2781915.1 hypothetical protein [Streptomyces caniscabiei]
MVADTERVVASVNDTAAGFHSFGVMVSGLVRILRTKSNSVLR